MFQFIFRIGLAVLCSSTVFSPLSIAQDTKVDRYFNAERVAKIERYIEQGMAEERVPGTAIALIEAGEVTYLKGFGIADGDGTKVSPQTPFQLASLTKSFSALLVLQLEQDGLLSLSDRVVDHIPWFSTLDKDQSDQITIRHLLQHNSGLSTQSGNYSQNSTYRGADATELSVKALSSTKLKAKPGTSYQYSNSNYHIVSHLVEVIAGKPFEQVMDERILQPLEMKNSYVQMPLRETVKEAVGFPQWFGYSVERPFVLGRMKMGDGGMVASAEDLTKYILEITHGKSGLVSREMRENLLNPELNSTDAYALGWQISSVGDDPFYQHDGGNGGFITVFGFSDSTEQRDDIGFIVLTNSTSALNDQFIWNVRRLILDREVLPRQMNKVNLISLIMMPIVILVLAFFLFRVLRSPSPARVSAKSFIIPTLLLGYSYSQAYVIPGMSGTHLFSIYPFYPDLAVGLFGCALLSLILAVILILKLTGLWKNKVSI